MDNNGHGARLLLLLDVLLELNPLQLIGGIEAAAADASNELFCRMQQSHLSSCEPTREEGRPVASESRRGLPFMGMAPLP